ncbi:hypothetical protein BDY19DRAFT_905864 [Irpex rosettiformis]|uniref:Uncharacterized protein n=1 Tax=Irpex rosettiformis TaxID=378272 RepID=A0ACB8U592_9APHY|nr:hypothetical protein BDY19DRAFT_905864 [Irpex rosettiformis]
MQTSNASDTVAGTRDGRINYFLVSIGVTILYYDYTITIGAEYLYVWRSWSYFRSKACICLLLARYFPLFGTLVMLCGYLFAFDEHSFVDAGVSIGCLRESVVHSKLPLASCSNLAVCHEVVLIITQVLVAVIQFLRTYALYCKQKRIVAFLICSVAAGIAVNVWAMISQPGNILVQQGCYFTSSTTSAIRELSPTPTKTIAYFLRIPDTAVQWEVALAYDASIFLLTLFKTYDWQSYLKYGIRGPPNTISLMYRHGAIYFG